MSRILRYVMSRSHGLVLLTLDGVRNNVALTIDTLLDDATRIMMFGMAPPPKR